MIPGSWAVPSDVRQTSAAYAASVARAVLLAMDRRAEFVVGESRTFNMTPPWVMSILAELRTWFSPYLGCGFRVAVANEYKRLLGRKCRRSVKKL